MEELRTDPKFDRSQICINTKIGRYEADPKFQFDFSYNKTLQSCELSLQRMKCEYIDVLQLHDPEFAPSLDLLMKETIPAMLECRKRGHCKALGMTGFPLQTQYQVICRSMELFNQQDDNDGSCIWDQSLTYGHYNLCDTSLMDQPLQQQYSSFVEFCQHHKIGISAAAPLAMGLYSSALFELPDWHPAPKELVEACKKATAVAQSHQVDITSLALVFALSNPSIPCTLLGMKNVAEVKVGVACANRFRGLEGKHQDEILKLVLTEAEQTVLAEIRDSINGPFAALWENGLYTWDGVKEARSFWKQVDGTEQVDWHMKDNENDSDSTSLPISCYIDPGHPGMFRITRSKGKALQSGGFGVAIVVITQGDSDADHDSNFAKKKGDVHNFLFLEEVLFLHEQGMLECWPKPPSVASLQDTAAPLTSPELYGLMPSCGLEMTSYLVYAHLRQQTFRVLRYTSKRLALLQECQEKSDLNQTDRRALHLRLRQDVQQAPSPNIIGASSSSSPKPSFAFCIYLPDSNFSKSNPGLPSFLVAITHFQHNNSTNSNGAGLTFSVLQELLQQAQGIPIKVATVSDSGTVVMFGISDVGVPILEGTKDTSASENV